MLDDRYGWLVMEHVDAHSLSGLIAEPRAVNGSSLVRHDT